jgi:hypothetical protein
VWNFNIAQYNHSLENAKKTIRKYTPFFKTIASVININFTLTYQKLNVEMGYELILITFLIDWFLDFFSTHYMSITIRI